MVHEEAAEPGQRGPHIAAMHHHIDHSVFLQVLGPLEPLRQLLAHRLLDHPRSRKADESTGLGDVDISQHGI